MKFPGYPSNREADERVMEATANAGRRASRMKPSRETCLHCESIIPLGMGYAIVTGSKAAGLISVPQGGTLFLCEKAPSADSFDQS